MVMTQDIPARIASFIQEHQLWQTDLLRNEPVTGLEAAQADIAALAMRCFTELASQASGREVLWNAAHEAHELVAAATSAAQWAQVVATHQGAGLVKAVLDDRYHGTVNTIARSAGVQPVVVGALVEVVTLAALAVLGALAAEQHWSAQALGSWLRPRLSAMVPLTPAGPASSPALAPPPLQPPPVPPASHEDDSSPTWFSRHANTLLAVVSVIAAAEFGYILGTRPNGPAAQYNASPEAATAAAASQPAAMPVVSDRPHPAMAAQTPLPVVLKLEDGQRQFMGPSSTEGRLYQFLTDPNQKIDQVNPTKGWIGFDRIYFETNEATLTRESRRQLSNIARILQRFPNAKIKLGGYTDVVGAPLHNLQLSRARAEAIRRSLISLGVPADHLTAVGYGALDNVASNDTENGRALNRRVSMQVVQK